MSPSRQTPSGLRLRATRRCLGRHARAATLVLTMIAVPLGLLALAPSAIGLAAAPLDTEAEVALPDPQTGPLTFLDAEGNVIGTRGGIAGDRLTLAEMPAWLPAAFIAMEDRRFYHHAGIDYL